MTDEQIVNFIEHRAKIAGQQIRLYNPKLILYHNNGSCFYLGIKFDNYNDAFIIRFMNGSMRGLFKIKPQDSTYESWRKQHCRQDGSIYTMEYDLSTLPPCVKHFVSYAIIEALKTKGMGFDMFTLASYKEDLKLIDPNESYEEAVIESDLIDFSFD